mmetsp:Transcript_1029/g.3778  ORF Transcript_1029/g.3778 Transcript_1029/m.3778 type:complete len:398 (+) Transcript_1029:808-2001(+)
MPTQQRWYLSYNVVRQWFVALSMRPWTKRRHCLSESFGLKRRCIASMASLGCPAKQGKWSQPDTVISARRTRRCRSRRSARKVRRQSSRKRQKCSGPTTSRNSVVSLNGAASKPMLPPGEPGGDMKRHRLGNAAFDVADSSWTFLDAAKSTQEHVPKVNVRDSPLGVQQDVAVVPVLELKEVGHDARGGQRFYEVGSRLRQPRARGAKVALEEVQQSVVVRVVAPERVERDRVWHGLDEARVWRRGQHVVRRQPDGHVRVAKNRRRLRKELRSKLFLAQVVARLDDHGHEAPAGDVVAARFGAEALFDCGPPLAEDDCRPRRGRVVGGTKRVGTRRRRRRRSRPRRRAPRRARRQHRRRRFQHPHFAVGGAAVEDGPVAGAVGRRRRGIAEEPRCLR